MAPSPSSADRQEARMFTLGQYSFNRIPRVSSPCSSSSIKMALNIDERNFEYHFRSARASIGQNKVVDLDKIIRILIMLYPRYPVRRNAHTHGFIGNC